ncbi:MAG: helix-turn-helix transcriptional regulator [Candidatus Omnitrophota bacterium]
MENELLLLGLLRENPKHGYQIKRQIKEIMQTFAGLRVKSIYYPLRKLEQNNLIAKKTAKVGRRPEKYVYELTEKGQARFDELLEKSFLEIQKPFIDIDIPLYFLKFADSVRAKKRLRARIMFIKKIEHNLEEIKKKYEAKPNIKIILEHDIHLVRAEIEFLAKIAEKL